MQINENKSIYVNQYKFYLKILSTGQIRKINYKDYIKIINTNIKKYTIINRKIKNIVIVLTF